VDCPLKRILLTNARRRCSPAARVVKKDRHIVEKMLSNRAVGGERRYLCMTDSVGQATDTKVFGRGVLALTYRPAQPTEA
jgi:hypothetical protein